MQEKNHTATPSNSNFFRTFLKKGGIRLRLTLIFSTLVLGMIAVLSTTIITIQGNSLKSKSFEVCEAIEIGLNASTRESIATDSLIILRDVLKNIRQAEISGLVKVDVFSVPRQLKKKSSDSTSQMYRIVASSGENRENKEPSATVLEYIAKSKESEKLMRYESVNEDNNPVFIFVKPVHLSVAGVKKWIGTIYIEYLESEVTQASKKAISISSIISFAVLLIAIFVIYRVGANITAPVLQIAKASRQVGIGDFSIQLDVRTNDELEELSKDFNTMVKGLNEKIKMEKFVSKSTVEMISGSSLKEDIGLSGKNEEIAFLFSDVRGFTAMSEKKTPREVVQILNHYLDLQSIIIKENGGDIDKYVGDEVMAVFHGENKRLQAIKAAVEIVEKIKEDNAERMKIGEDTVNVGIGLNVGEVVVGSMGSRFRMDYTCIGDSVNLAARLCSAAEPGTVLASHDMLLEEDVAKRFKTEELPPIKVKGKEKPISIYRVSKKTS